MRFRAAFGLGTLVFNGLEMAMHSMMEGSCLNDVVFVHPVLHGLFTFLQMHFLFVNSQVNLQSPPTSPSGQPPQRCEGAVITCRQWRVNPTSERNSFRHRYCSLTTLGVPQVLVERFGLAARFGFMHLAATNLALWIRLVVWESGNEWTYFVHLAQSDGYSYSYGGDHVPTPLQLRGFPRSVTDNVQQAPRARRDLGSGECRAVPSSAEPDEMYHSV